MPSDRLLLILRDPTTRPLVAGALGRDGHRCDEAGSLHEAAPFLADGPRAVVSDVTLPGGSGMRLAGETACPLILLADHPSLGQATAAIRAGAYEYLPKPVEPDGLRAALKAALKERRPNPKAKGATPDFVAESPAMRAVMETVARVAPSKATVMVFGESGVGKEVVARALHAASLRANGPFAPISCAAVPETLIESELFGYERGAFTGAQNAKPGRFEAASGGTLFLDEVGEIPLSVQAKLLRVVQDREIERLGSLTRTPIDVRLVTATHRDLREKVAEGLFRLDLLFRLQVIEIEVPPLRERPEDVMPLAERALVRFARENGRGPLAIPPAVERRLLAHDWPGNVRELENAMERAAVLAPISTDTAEIEDPLPPARRRLAA